MGGNLPKKNRPDETSADLKLIAGLTKHAATVPSLVISGTSVTAKDLIAKLQARVDSANAVLTTRATWQSAVQADRVEQAATRTFVSAVRQGLLVAFGSQLDALGDFGLTPHKARVLTPEQKLAAAAKAKATAQRATLGTKQKAAIKGTVTTTAPATAATPAALPPQTPTAPQPAAPTTPTATSTVVPAATPTPARSV